MDFDNEEQCVFCEPPYVMVAPDRNRCVRERNTERQKNCQILFTDGTCLFCDFGYYLTLDGCVRNPELEFTYDNIER